LKNTVSKAAFALSSPTASITASYVVSWRFISARQCAM